MKKSQYTRGAPKPQEYAVLTVPIKCYSEFTGGHVVLVHHILRSVRYEH
jgi:hypothetical protein